MTTAVFFFFFPVQRRRLLPFLQWCSNGWEEDDELRKADYGWAVLLCLCSWWRWCRSSRLWSLFLFSSVVASSLYFCHLVSLQTILCLSLSLGFPFFSFSPPCFYRQSGERFTIPCPSAGHDLPLPSSWWQGMRVWVVSVSGQVGGERRRG